jgi:hypothetical protein
MFVALELAPELSISVERRNRYALYLRSGEPPWTDEDYLL